MPSLNSPQYLQYLTYSGETIKETMDRLKAKRKRFGRNLSRKKLLK